MRLQATGSVEVRDGHRVLRLMRTFRAPIEDVWAAVTEPERLARWIGTFSGDPATGRVAFRMTAEEDPAEQDPAATDLEIRACKPRTSCASPPGWAASHGCSTCT